MNTQTIPFINPATGENFGEVAAATVAEVQAARREMAATAVTWSQKSVKERVQALRQLQQLLIDEVDEITAVMNQDGGKSRQDAMAELFITVDLLNQYCQQAPKWLRRRRISSGLQLFKRCYTEKRPYGVAAIISPWNYPLVETLPPLFAALLAGNTALVKPSEVTPAVGVMMAGWFQRIPALAPYVRFLHGDGQIGAALVAAKPDLIYVTGSTRTGRLIMQAAAEHLIPVICELGGKDPMIVLEDADIAAAARWGAWGAFYNTGQTCMAVERVYVVESVYEAFLTAVLEETKQLKVGYSSKIDSPYHIGPLTFQRQIQIIEDHVQDALAKGAKILWGGEREGMFMQPMVMVDVDHSMKIMQEETFGPIMPIMKVTDETHAIQLANHSDFGLSASVWSQNVRRAQGVAHQLQVGSVNINDTITHFAIPNLPFGGVKQSGIGRAHGEEEVLQFAQTRAYAVGVPPLPFDLATILRQPGHYKLGTAIMHLAFGVTPKQRLQPIVEALQPEKTDEPEAHPAVNGSQPRFPVGALATAVGLTAAFLAFIFSLSRGKQ
ncbi:MAG: aldehyde dehydrogenase family protein [Ardenticatenaceae bacterium]|nr:aldehyde dehydrogenase family protein [Ardenticatenaceae bacterium]